MQNISYRKKYTPRYDDDFINKKYFEDKINNIFGVGYIYIGSNPTNILKGSWEKIDNVTIGSKSVEAYIRIK